jgi:hypothetical protein
MGLDEPANALGRVGEARPKARRDPADSLRAL